VERVGFMICSHGFNNLYTGLEKSLQTEGTPVDWEETLQIEKISADWRVGRGIGDPYGLRGYFGKPMLIGGSPVLVGGIPVDWWKPCIGWGKPYHYLAAGVGH
jgi:hypothetical protein